MKYIRQSTPESFSNFFVHQQGPMECWFACSMMVSKINGSDIIYDIMKKGFYSTNTYKMYLAFMKEVSLPALDPMIYGASSDMVCSYLNEIPQSGSPNFYAAAPVKMDEKLDAIKESIDSNHPVIMAVNNFHYILVIGYDQSSRSIAYLNPWDNTFSVNTGLLHQLTCNELILYK